MNKPLRRIDSGSYRPVATRRVYLTLSTPLHDSSDVAARRVGCMFVGVGAEPIPLEGLEAAEAALARLDSRLDVNEADFISSVADEFSKLRG